MFFLRKSKVLDMVKTLKKLINVEFFVASFMFYFEIRHFSSFNSLNLKKKEEKFNDLTISMTKSACFESARISTKK